MGDFWYPQAGSTIAGFLSSRKAYIRDNAGLSLLVGGALILSFGFALTNYAIALDEEAHLWKDFTFGWFLQGRPTVTLMKLVLGEFLPLPFVNLALSLVFLLVSLLLWLCLFEEAAGTRFPIRGATILFGVFYATLPINGYYLAFNTYNVEVSIGFILAALAVSFTWRWGVLGGGWPALLLSVLFAFLAAGTYQSLVVVCLAGLVAACCVQRLAAPGTTTAPLTLVRIAILAAPLVAGGVGSVVLGRLILPSNGYTEGFVQWGHADPLIVLDTLWRYVITVIRGDGFPGGWAVSASALAGLAVVLLALRRAFATGDWLLPLLVVGLVVLPFLLSFAVGTPLPKRAQQAMPLSFGVLWILLALSLPRRPPLNGAFLIAAFLLATWSAQANTQLSLAKYFAFNHDRALAGEIATALHAAGWDGAPLPLVQIGKPVMPERRYWTADETIGASFFEWSNEGRGLLLMYILGYEVRPATSEQAAVATRMAETMPAWPRPGSVVVRDGFGVVNFGTE